MDKEITFQQVIIYKTIISNCEKLTKEEEQKIINSTMYHTSKLTYGIGIIEKSDPELLTVTKVTNGDNCG